MSRGHGVIAEERLLNQSITRAGFRRPDQVVAWSGAIQAQEYDPATWGIGLRMRDGTVAVDVERAFERGELLRTHVMRPTWHFVTPADIRWLLELTGPRVRRVMAAYNRKLGLDDRVLRRGAAVIERSFRGDRFLTRPELKERLARAGFELDVTRLAHLVMHAELEGVICSGPRREKRFTYALLAERAPAARRLPRDEALAELTRRYFRSHGPATIRDFVWWSGLTTADAKRGLEMIRARGVEVDGLTYWRAGRPPRGARREANAHLLPIYDEYLVAYRDRVAVPHGPATIPSASSFVTFQHAVLIAGQVAGTWRTTPTRDRVRLAITPLRPLTARERRALGEAADRYERFLGAPVALLIA